MKMPDHEFLWLCESIAASSFRFAKSAPNNPHWYTVRKTWDRDQDFVRAVTLIREYGYTLWFGGRPYTCFDINGMRYWTMGDPMKTTWILNRARNENRAAYDKLAVRYDDITKDDRHLKEDEKIKAMLPSIDHGEAILDIGCGTGLLTEMTGVEPRFYKGIDPSRKMLRRFAKKHPSFESQMVTAPFESYYGRTPFRFVFSLFGSISYVDPSYITRLNAFTTPNAKIFLMFYQDGYTPFPGEPRYEKPTIYNVSECVEALKHVCHAVKTEPFGKFIIVKGEK